MTTNDTGERPDAAGVEQLEPAAESSGGESLTSPVLPASAPTTTPLGLDGGADAGVTTELELAVELADELVLTLDLNGVGEPTEPGPAGEADPDDVLPWHQPLQVWVDAGDVLAGFGVDGWAEFDELDRQVRALHDELGPDHGRTRAAMADRDAVDALSRQDEKTYQEALTAAVQEVARERRIEVEVLPVRMAQTGSGGSGSTSEVDELLAAAVRRAALPQLGRPPLDLADDAVVAAVRAAGRTYRERIRTDERPVPAVLHDELEEELRTELQADELIPDDAS
ncbi:hypothetical protein [Promicromonospora sukumoe]|uniref:hypothetical protein n=1 Tax=Promicromonospora sukumoe TaxID=88382 RepID=UPI00036679DF|nr:hypothetical protein [Promicromonospora sukumoe]